MNTSSALMLREIHLSKLREARGPLFIKVLAGMRGCGKTTILRTLMEEMLDSGISGSSVYWRELDVPLPEFNSPSELLEDIKSKVGDLGNATIFLDEVQVLEGWERVVSTLYNRGADVYISGSDTDLMYSELGTFLSGRFIQFDVRALTFSEYLVLRGEGDRAALFRDFLRHGSLPPVAILAGRSPESVEDMIEGMYHTVCVRDIIGRKGLRDASLVSPIVAVLMRNLGKRVSMRSIAKQLADMGHKVTSDTVASYVDAMRSAGLIIRARRVDAKYRDDRGTIDKYYIADLGFRNILLPFDEADMQGLLENIVFNELLVRHRNAAVCDVNGMEVDFIADPVQSPSYYQVCPNMFDSKEVGGAVRALKAIGDNYPKTIITCGRHIFDNIEGINVVDIVDWLTGKS